MKEIKLTQGKVALVDDEDYERLVAMGKWCFHNKGYAMIIKELKKPDGQRTSKAIYMHRVIMGAEKGVLVDHRDCNGLNNQKSNLRLCSYAQNGQNSRLQSRNKAGYKGVYWDLAKQKWRAMITIDQKMKHIGHYESILDAATAYNDMALKHFGEFAKLNEI